MKSSGRQIDRGRRYAERRFAVVCANGSSRGSFRSGRRTDGLRGRPRKPLCATSRDARWALRDGNHRDDGMIVRDATHIRSFEAHLPYGQAGLYQTALGTDLGATDQILAPPCRRGATVK